MATPTKKPFRCWRARTRTWRKGLRYRNTGKSICAALRSYTPRLTVFMAATTGESMPPRWPSFSAIAPPRKNWPRTFARFASERLKRSSRPKAMLLGEWSEAEDWYCRAALLGGKRFGDLCSTRRNARLIVSYLQTDVARFERCFHIPSVALFAGHMIDQPGRTVP